MQNKQTHFFHSPNKFPQKTQRTIHLLPIIFNFPFCPIPIRYSTEIFVKFFHLPPPICIQLPYSQTWYGFALHTPPPTPPHLHLKQTLCMFYYLLEAMSHSCSIARWCWSWTGIWFWCFLAWAANTCTYSLSWSISLVNGGADVLRSAGTPGMSLWLLPLLTRSRWTQNREQL